MAERRAAIVGLARRSDEALRRGNVPPVPVRATMAQAPSDAEVSYEEIERTGDSTRREAGMPPGARRTGRFRSAPMKIFDRFAPTLTRPAPWGYAIAATDTTAISLARLHGLEMSVLDGEWRGDAGPQFVTDSTILAPQPFEGHRIVRLAGRWDGSGQAALPAGTVIVRVAQPLGVLAMYLLEPESDDGLVAWDIGLRSARTPGTAPIVRLATQPGVRMTPLPKRSGP